MKVLSDGKPIQKFEMLALPKEMAEEVLILSDMYDLDELMSLELLNTGNYKCIICFKLQIKIYFGL